uniref:BRCT domain-containing protein n=1 Tax=Mesocestoides corti TaxID=53468 RepID=A0A5K3FP05_MESCO
MILVNPGSKRASEEIFIVSNEWISLCQTLTSETYYDQLIQLNVEIQAKHVKAVNWNGFIYHRANTAPQIAKLTLRTPTIPALFA